MRWLPSPARFLIPALCFALFLSVAAEPAEKGNSQISIAPSIAADATATPRLKPGMKLEVFVLENLDSPGSIPQQVGAGAMSDNGELFSPGVIVTDDYLKRFLNRKATGFLWRGLLKIEETGTHVLVATFANEKTNLHPKAFFRVRIEGKYVVNGETLFQRAGGDTVVTQSLDLEPGLYRLETWIAFVPDSGYGENSVPQNLAKLSVDLRGPKDRIPRAINPRLFQRDEENSAAGTGTSAAGVRFFLEY